MDPTLVAHGDYKAPPFLYVNPADLILSRPMTDNLISFAAEEFFAHSEELESEKNGIVTNSYDCQKITMDYRNLFDHFHQPNKCEQVLSDASVGLHYNHIITQPPELFHETNNDATDDSIFDSVDVISFSCSSSVTSSTPSAPLSSSHTTSISDDISISTPQSAENVVQVTPSHQSDNDSGGGRSEEREPADKNLKQPTHRHNPAKGRQLASDSSARHTRKRKPNRRGRIAKVGTKTSMPISFLRAPKRPSKEEPLGRATRTDSQEGGRLPTAEPSSRKMTLRSWNRIEKPSPTSSQKECRRAKPTLPTPSLDANEEKVLSEGEPHEPNHVYNDPPRPDLPTSSSFAPETSVTPNSPPIQSERLLLPPPQLATLNRTCNPPPTRSPCDTIPESVRLPRIDWQYKGCCKPLLKPNLPSLPALSLFGAPKRAWSSMMLLAPLIPSSASSSFPKPDPDSVSEVKVEVGDRSRVSQALSGVVKSEIV